MEDEGDFFAEKLDFEDDGKDQVRKEPAAINRVVASNLDPATYRKKPYKR